MANDGNGTSGTGPLRIVFVTDWLAARGSTTYSLMLARELMKRGHAVRVIYPGGEMEDLFRRNEIDLDVHWAMSTPFLSFLSLRTAAWSVRHYRADLVHVQCREAARFGCRLAGLCHLPSVLTVHTFDSPRRLRVPRRTRILAVSQALREFLVNESKVPKDKIDVVPNGLDLSCYRATKPFGKPDQVPVVGSFGRLEPVRGFEYFIKAAKIVVDAGHKVEFLIVGAGSDESRLRDLVSRLDMSRCITFRSEPSDYSRRIDSMDVVVVCPMKEGFGMVALEAMACGRPVIASAVGGIYSLVKDGETGLLVPPKDPDSIAERIIALLRDTDEAERLGLRARAMAEEKFTMEIVAGKTEAVYRKAMEA
jgi:glycosyltransferase involved in cell wall biosynthesis